MLDRELVLPGTSVMVTRSSLGISEREAEWRGEWIEKNHPPHAFLFCYNYFMRINKYLTQANYCSRREADRLIEQGSVKINGRKAVLGDRVGAEDEVKVGKKTITLIGVKKIYLAYHKPTNTVTTSDPRIQDNIINRLNYPERVYPIGRLDVQTTGLILLTNDGSIVNKILKAQNKIEKEYLAVVNKNITSDFLAKLRAGVTLHHRKTRPVKIRKLTEKSFLITLIEGRYRQIKRMVETFDYKIVRLTRTRIGRMVLGNLKVGRYKEFAEKEFKSLLGIK